MVRLAYFLIGLLAGLWLSEMLREDRQSAGERALITPSNARSVRQNKPKSRAAADDLTLISGLGPVAAQALNDIGIHTFLQLAAQNEAELVAHLPTGVGTRVGRDNWIEQAEQLARK